MEVLEPWSLLLWRAFCSREIQLDDKEGRFLHSNLWDSCKFVEGRNNYAFLSSWLAQPFWFDLFLYIKTLRKQREIFILLFWVREKHILWERRHTLIHIVFLSFLSLSPFPYQWEKVFIHHLIYHIYCWLLLVLEIIESNTINPKGLGGLQLVTQRTHTED